MAMQLHARLLLDFFEHERGARRRERDVYCFDFGFEPRHVDVSQDDRDRLDKDIAHLTYWRLRHTPTSRPWPLNRIVTPVAARAAEFVSYAVDNPPNGASADELERWKSLQLVFANSRASGK
ncbi:MAG TPA: hypothetical protein VHX65_03930 [Pirellulales bacterium]|nr:hypothetical protein [Pirellulales bacterium]